MVERMTGKTLDTFLRMMQLRKERGDFVGDDPGTFYRNQKLLTLIREGKINEDNIDSQMTKEAMSANELPVNWYYEECYPNPQDIIWERQYNNLQISKETKHQRGKLTKLRLKFLFHDILMQRLDRYEHPEKYTNNKILCIVGQSGAGKTLCSLHLQNKLGANVICSFTTRPPRATEVEGREHHFINIVPDPNEMLAYAVFSGYEYYALKTQVHGDCTVYVIDEQGLLNLKQEHGNEYRIFSVYLTRSWMNRKKSGITHGRMERDNNRMTLPKETYDWTIENNSTKKELFVNIERIYNEVKNK